MNRKKMISFEDWENEKMNDEAFRAEAEKLEPGYQIARLRIQRGMTQAELAAIAGTQQPSIARLENGSGSLSLAFLERIADALDAEIEISIQPKKKEWILES